jgi:hypothetical protein
VLLCAEFEKAVSFWAEFEKAKNNWAKTSSTVIQEMTEKVSL